MGGLVLGLCSRVQYVVVVLRVWVLLVFGLRQACRVWCGVRVWVRLAVGLKAGCVCVCVCLFVFVCGVSRSARRVLCGVWYVVCDV